MCVYVCVAQKARLSAKRYVCVCVCVAKNMQRWQVYVFDGAAVGERRPAAGQGTKA